jgi:hypothetical protein
MSLKKAMIISVMMLVSFNIALTQSGKTASTAQTQPEVWMSMRHGVPDLAGEDASWPFVLEHLDGLKYMRSNLFTYATPEDVNAVGALLKKHGIKAHLEVSGPTAREGDDIADVGIRSAEWDMRNIGHVAEAAGEVVFLDVDWQVHRLVKALGQEKPGLKEGELLDLCMDQFVIYIKTIRQKYPDVEFFLLSNFPNWRWKGERANTIANWGDYWEVVSRAVPRCRAAGVPLRGITVDFPYNYIMREGDVDWVERVRKFERYARSEKLEFNLIVNCQTGGKDSDALFSENTLAYVDLYRSSGGRPDRYIVQSWYDHPKCIVPESEPGSMTHLVAEIIRRVKKK